MAKRRTAVCFLGAVCLVACGEAANPSYLLPSEDGKAGCDVDTKNGCAPLPNQEATGESSSAIVGGVESKPNAWPGVVAIYGRGQQLCGGSLIADRWVLTAAHCVDHQDGLNGGLDTAIVGRYALGSSFGESIKVDVAYSHPRYSSANNDNDVALLHLVASSKNEKVKLVSATQKIFEGTNIAVVGWGNIAQGGDQSNVLREVVVPLVSHAQCTDWYLSSAKPRRVTDNQFCAGLAEGGKDSCQGDSGGPLFMMINNEKVQTGVVSWGYGCAQPKAPGVYTRLSNYRDWISSTISTVN